MEAPDFWDNAEISQKKMKELKGMKDDMETYQNLVTQKEDMETLIEMSYEENDPSMIEEIQEMLDEFQAQFDSIRVKTLLSGEYDGENARAFQLKFWTIWTAMKLVSNLLPSR